MGLSFFPKFVCFAITGGEERWQILSTSRGGGLQRTWDRIKAYLNTWIASWKTTNFGSGTYSNNGILSVKNADFKAEAMHMENKLLVDLSARDMRWVDKLYVTNGYCYGIRTYWTTITSPTRQVFVNDYDSTGYFMIISNNSVQNIRVEANAEFEATVLYGMVIICFIH